MKWFIIVLQDVLENLDFDVIFISCCPFIWSRFFHVELKIVTKIVELLQDSQKNNYTILLPVLG